MLTAFALAALVAGFTGSWSPCGFSMIDTLAPSGFGLRRSTRVAASAAFVPGTLLGGVITFGGLAVLGALVHAGRWPALGLGVLALAALFEAAGVRVRPQVRRQVPESWRRVLPLPVASFGYGVLLGLGWTTYVLTLAVWALFALSFALGDPAFGLVAGLAFGLGRAVPIVLLAAVIDTPRGERVAEAMAERPRLLRGVRLVDAIALAAVAVVLAPATALGATSTVATGAIDPSASSGDLVYEQGGRGILRRGAGTRVLPGRAPAAGDGWIAWRQGSLVTIADRATLTPQQTLTLPGAGKLAISQTWLAWRVVTASGDRIYARRVDAAPDTASTLVASVAGPAQLGRPTLSGARIAYHVASTRSSTIRIVNLATGARSVFARGRRGQVLNPAIGPSSVLYERLTYCRQTLVVRRGGRERTLAVLGPLVTRGADHGPGHTTQGSEPSKCHPERRKSATMLWTTALTGRSAFVTRVRGGATRLVRIGR